MFLKFFSAYLSTMHCFQCIYKVNKKSKNPNGYHNKQQNFNLKGIELCLHPVLQTPEGGLDIQLRSLFCLEIFPQSIEK